MKVFNVNDDCFKEYGRILSGYDYSELFEKLSEQEIPDNGIVYKASVAAFEKCGIHDEILLRSFGGYPIQIGYVGGTNRTMKCLEYHKSSELNIAMNDIILILASEKEINNGIIDSSSCKAFFVPANVGVELYATTLHYAPLNTDKNGYRVICVLPKGTNGAKKNFTVKNYEDKMCFGINKWLLAHKDSDEADNGAYVGIIGKNIKYEDLEEFKID